ncbi:carboxylesterase family protein [Streptomyces sp. MT29]|nr:carboxylesterase family protein [Streptomyces sp. MT29]
MSDIVEARARTVQGTVRGAVERGVAVFRGIPYAAAPVGARRFRAPEPPEPWEGVRDALAFGPTAPKRPYSPPLDRLLPDPAVEGEGWLNLNVWTPSTEEAERAEGLPVLVWIHGGSLLHGSSAVPVYDGAAFARDGVVLVSVNYRLGVEGFGLFPDAPANRGLLDQLAALEWVRDNIAAFGGDPGRVTVAGESAGAVSVGALLANGPGDGAVAAGGPPERGARRPHPGCRARDDRADRPAARRPRHRRRLRRRGPGALLTAQTEVTSGGNPLTGRNSFQLVVDGELLTQDPAEALRTGSAAAGVDLLLGTNTEEYRLWFVPGGLTERISRLKLRLALLKFRVPNATARTYRANRTEATPGELLGALATDLLLRVPLNRLADARAGAPGSTYVYEFGWPSPVQRLGACHALELGFVFDTLAHPDTMALTGPDAPQELADAMHRAWVEFATTGDPGWPSWDASRPVRFFGPGAPALVLAPRDDELQSWGRG